MGPPARPDTSRLRFRHLSSLPGGKDEFDLASLPTDFQKEFDAGSLMSYSDDCFGEHECSEEQSRIEEGISDRTCRIESVSLSLRCIRFLSNDRSLICCFSYAILGLKPQNHSNTRPTAPYNKSNLNKLYFVHV